jgi:hypothetical protein
MVPSAADADGAGPQTGDEGHGGVQAASSSPRGETMRAVIDG